MLSNGDISWNGQSGVAVGVGTDQQGGSTNVNGQTEQPAQFEFWWPGFGGNYTDFFQVATGSNKPGLAVYGAGGGAIGRTFGLLQQSNNLPTPDPQWPLATAPESNFAVNPLNGNQLIISSNAGRIFGTENQGVTWLEIGNPAALDSTYAPALAYGAPDPNGPGGIGNLDNFLYAGTEGGHIYVTQTGGGASGNAWANISLGLDGSPVQQIITNPTRGSHEAYAITAAGVYHVADSVALANAVAAAAQPGGPAVPASVEWQNITANLFALTHTPFGNSALTETQLKNGLGEFSLPDGGLTSIIADWRYVIPDSAKDPTKPAGSTTATHPVLYAAGGAGVYRSLDDGLTWSIFPSAGLDQAPADGGYLPNAQVSDLNIVLGNIDPTTGRAIQKPGDPNLLLATTFGRGDFGIRLAPVVFPNTATSPNAIKLDPALPAPGGSVGGVAPNGGPLVTIPNPVIDGVSEQSAFGNTVRISLYDLTDPNNPKLIGGYDPNAGTGGFGSGNPTDVAANQTNAFGNFSVQVNTGAFQSNGVKTIGIQGTDSSGTRGDMATFSFTLNTPNLGLPTPPAPPTLQLLAADDSSHGQNITNVTQPHLVGSTDGNVQVALLDANGNVVPLVNPLNPAGPSVTSVTSNAVNGSFSLQPYTPLAPGVYKFRAVATNKNGSTYSPFISFTVKTVGPQTNTFLGLSPADDTGIVGDNITTDRTPHFVGTTDPGAIVNLLQLNPDGTTTTLATTTADGSGNYSIQLPQNLSNGTITLETVVQDVAGNQDPNGPSARSRCRSRTSSATTTSTPRPSWRSTSPPAPPRPPS